MRGDVRDRISDHYTRLVNARDAETSALCGSTAALAGYRPEDLDGGPSSFGCGNPLAFSEVRSGDVVLDLGCGAGLDLLLAAQQVGNEGRVIGVDMTDEMIDRARANVREAGFDNVEVRKGFIEALPVEIGSVDWVISNCVVSLSTDKPRVFAEIARVLAPGGRMQISDLVARDIPGWLRALAGFFHPGAGGVLSERAYLDGLRAVGLSDVSVLDRLVYDATQLGPIVRGELPGWLATTLGFSGKGGERRLKRLLDHFEGRVWSALFHARK